MLRVTVENLVAPGFAELEFGDGGDWMVFARSHGLIDQGNEYTEAVVSVMFGERVVYQRKGGE